MLTLDERLKVLKLLIPECLSRVSKSKRYDLAIELDAVLRSEGLTPDSSESVCRALFRVSPQKWLTIPELPGTLLMDYDIHLTRQTCYRIANSLKDTPYDEVLINKNGTWTVIENDLSKFSISKPLVLLTFNSNRVIAVLF